MRLKNPEFSKKNIIDILNEPHKITKNGQNGAHGLNGKKLVNRIRNKTYFPKKI